MMDQDAPDPEFNAMTARLLRREALRRAAEELNTTSGPGLEQALARISADVTAEAAYQKAAASGKTGPGVTTMSRPGAFGPSRANDTHKRFQHPADATQAGDSPHEAGYDRDVALSAPMGEGPS